MAILSACSSTQTKSAQGPISPTPQKQSTLSSIGQAISPKNVANKILAPTPVAKDVAYANALPSQKLDVYMPSTGTSPYPVVVNIHGGGFKSGDKANPEALNALLKAGYAVVSINYRLSGEAKWPAQLDDIKSALEFIKINSYKYEFDHNRIAVFGQSAGGTLAALSGVALSTDPVYRIKAVVDWFGPSDFYNMDKDITARSWY